MLLSYVICEKTTFSGDWHVIKITKLPDKLSENLIEARAIISGYDLADIAEVIINTTNKLVKRQNIETD